MSTTEQNKAVVRRFNTEVLEQMNEASIHELLADDVVNHTAAPGTPPGKENFTFFLKNVLGAGFPERRVEIHEQIAEGDLVVTRKTIHSTHTGEVFGIPPTNKPVEIKVIDIIRVRNGQYVEHWGQSNLMEVIAKLREG